jgi:hypothetical protein
VPVLKTVSEDVGIEPRGTSKIFEGAGWKNVFLRKENTAYFSKKSVKLRAFDGRKK